MPPSTPLVPQPANKAIPMTAPGPDPTSSLPLTTPSPVQHSAPSVPTLSAQETAADESAKGGSGTTSASPAKKKESSEPTTVLTDPSALQSLLCWLHGFPSCAVNAAAKAYCESWVAPESTASSGAAGAASAQSSGEKRKRLSTEVAAAAAAAAAAKPPSKALVERSIKAYAAISSVSPDSKIKVWAVSPSAWSTAGVKEPPTLIAQEGVEKPKGPPSGKRAKAAKGENSAGASDEPSAETADADTSAAVPPTEDIDAPEGTIALTTGDDASAAAGAGAGVGAGTAVRESKPKTEPKPKAESKVKATPVPSGPPVIDPRANMYMGAIRDTVEHALSEFCVVSTGGVSSSSAVGAAAATACVLGTFFAEAHVGSLIKAALTDMPEEVASDSPVAVPAAVHGALAFLVQGSAQPLSVLATAVSTLFSSALEEVNASNVSANEACPGAAEIISLPSWASPASLTLSLPLVAERKCHGSKPAKGAVLLEDTARSCVWRWEVSNNELLLIPHSDVDPIGPDVDAMSGSGGGGAGGAGMDAAAVDSAGAPVKKRASPEARRVINQVVRERAALRILGEKVRAAIKAIDALTTAADGPGPDEVKVADATERFAKASREWEVFQERERARVAKVAADAAAKAAAKIDRVAKATAQKTEREQAREAARIAEKAARKAAEEKAKGVTSASQRLFAGFFGAKAPAPPTSAPAPAPSTAPAAAAAVPRDNGVSPAPLSAVGLAPAAAEVPQPDPPSAVTLTALAPGSLITDRALAVEAALGSRPDSKTVFDDFASWRLASLAAARERKAARHEARSKVRESLLAAATSAQSAFHAGAPVSASSAFASAAFVDLTTDDGERDPTRLISAGLVPGKLCRAKTLKFHEDERFAFFGTFSAARSAAKIAKAARLAAEEEAAARAAGAMLDNDAAGDDGAEVTPYINVSGLVPRVSGRRWLGARVDIFDYTVDSEAEWEAAPDDEEGLDLERASDGEDDDEEGVDDGGAGGATGAHDIDALDYADGWLCADDHLEFDAEARARDAKLRAAAAEGGDGSDRASVISRIPGDDDDCEIESVCAASVANAEAMPCAAPSVLAALTGSKRSAGDTAVSDAQRVKRRIVLPTAASLADVREFVFGLCPDLSDFVARQPQSSTTGALRDLLGGRIEVLVTRAAPLALTAPAPYEENFDDCDAASVSDAGGEKARAKVPATFPVGPLLLEALVRLLHGSAASVSKIIESFQKHSAAAGAVPKKAIENKIREISVKGRYDYVKPAKQVAPTASAEESGMGGGAGAGAGDTAHLVAVTCDRPESNFEAIAALPFIRAVMHAESVSAPTASYNRLKFVVHDDILAALGISLDPKTEEAAIALAAHVDAHFLATGEKKIKYGYTGFQAAIKARAAADAVTTVTAAAATKPSTKQVTLSFPKAATASSPSKPQ